MEDQQVAKTFEDFTIGNIYLIQDGGNISYVGYYSGLSPTTGKPTFTKVKRYQGKHSQNIGNLEYDVSGFGLYYNFYYIYNIENNKLGSLKMTLYVGAFNEVPSFGGNRNRKTKTKRRKTRKSRRRRK